MHPAIVAQPPRLSRIRKGLTLTKVRIADDTGAATVTFFNQDYIRDALRTGEDYVFYGAVEGSAGSRSMTNPAFERAECSRFTGRILPGLPLDQRGLQQPAGRIDPALRGGVRGRDAGEPAAGGAAG